MAGLQGNTRVRDRKWIHHWGPFHSPETISKLGSHYSKQCTAHLKMKLSTFSWQWSRWTRAIHSLEPWKERDNLVSQACLLKPCDKFPFQTRAKRSVRSLEKCMHPLGSACWKECFLFFVIFFSFLTSAHSFMRSRTCTHMDRMLDGGTNTCKLVSAHALITPPTLLARPEVIVI